MIKIESNQPNRTNHTHLMLSAAAGAIAGAGARYIAPTKAEMKAFKTGTDEFFSNAKVLARSENRAIVKYAGIGALIAGGVALLTKIFSKNNNKQPETQMDTFEFSKYAALIDTSEYAAELLIYEDDME